MPLGRAGSIPAQRTKKTAIRRFFCFNEVLEGNSAGFSLFFLGAEFKWGVQGAERNKTCNNENNPENKQKDTQYSCDCAAEIQISKYNCGQYSDDPVSYSHIFCKFHTFLLD